MSFFSAVTKSCSYSILISKFFFCTSMSESCKKLKDWAKEIFKKMIISPITKKID